MNVYYPVPLSKIVIFCCLTVVLLFKGSPVGAQTFKHIDTFGQNRYFGAFIRGKGSLTDTVIPGRGLRIAYRFGKGANASFSVMRNYDFYAQDYSFMPKSFALSLKGGHNCDKIRLRFWEDINRNGQFDGEDEIFVSPYCSLGGDTSRQTLQFSINSFERLEGHGNNLLDLNRIRAWDVEVKSNCSEPHSGELYLTDFRFYSHYTPLVFVKKASLTGTFITINAADSAKSAYWPQHRWMEEFQRMKKMNLHSIIVQYSVHQNRAWYFPCHLSYVNDAQPALNKIMAAARSANLSVYIGLTFDESWNHSDKSLESTYTDLFYKCRDNMDELYRLFGSDEAFAGWYIPQEINDYDWQTGIKKHLLFSWLQQVASYAHQKDVSKPVIIAPYFNLWQPADILALWYDDMLSNAPAVDRIYMQDGIGASTKSLHIDIPHYCRQIKAVCDKHGKKFRMVVEGFRQLTGWPIDNGRFSAAPTCLSQLNDQLQEAYRLNPQDIFLFNWDYLVKEE